MLGLSLTSVAGQVDSFPGLLPGTDIGGLLPPGYEPSGAVWHPRLEKLFVVSDNGLVSALDFQGASITNWAVPGDLEAITIADLSGPFVYVGVEHPDALLEFNFVQGVVTRTFDLTDTLMGPDASGLEALTFVDDPIHPEGGLFFAGLQQDGRVYVFDLPIMSSSTSMVVQHMSTFAPVDGRDDLSGLASGRDARLPSLACSSDQYSMSKMSSSGSAW